MMTPEEKDQKVADLQAKKEALKVEVNRAFRRSTDYYKLHKVAEQKYDRLKAEYEALDREEKFLTIDIKKATIKSPGRPKQSEPATPAAKKSQAMAALKNLSPEERARIINSFKK